MCAIETCRTALKVRVAEIIVILPICGEQILNIVVSIMQLVTCDFHASRDTSLVGAND